MAQLWILYYIFFGLSVYSLILCAIPVTAEPILASTTPPDQPELLGVFSVDTNSSLLVTDVLSSLSYLPFCLPVAPATQQMELIHKMTNNVLVNLQLINTPNGRRFFFPSLLLTTDMTSTYCCRAVETGRTSINQYTLHVIDPVIIRHFSVKTQNNELFSFIGTTISVQCCATGYPLPLLQVNGEPITSFNRTVDNAAWHCIEKNITSSAQAGRYQEINCSTSLSQTLMCTNASDIVHANQMCVNSLASTASRKTSILIAARTCTPSSLDSNISFYHQSNGNNFMSVSTLVGCGDGYSLPVDNRTNTTRCMADGMWESPIPICMDVDKCREFQDYCNGGACVNFDGGANCACPDNFTGERCTVKIAKDCDALHTGDDCETLSSLGIGIIVIAVIGSALIVGAVALWRYFGKRNGSNK